MMFGRGIKWISGKENHLLVCLRVSDLQFLQLSFGRDFVNLVAESKLLVNYKAV
jgi:hypothetical protein